mmetsp:Transcript_88489/g.222765  ORF Transcript_88489/g.222765 Transcript_88489/m.222765 type:complete len:256 (-) Transcript_88489:413-1180(-)
MEVLKHRAVAITNRKLMLRLDQEVVRRARVRHVMNGSCEHYGQQVYFGEVTCQVLLGSKLGPNIVRSSGDLSSMHPVVVRIAPIGGLDCPHELQHLLSCCLAQVPEAPGRPHAHEDLHQRLLVLPLQPEHINGLPRVHIHFGHTKRAKRAPGLDTCQTPATRLPTADDATLQLHLLHHILQVAEALPPTEQQAHPFVGVALPVRLPGVCGPEPHAPDLLREPLGQYLCPLHDHSIRVWVPHYTLVLSFEQGHRPS